MRLSITGITRHQAPKRQQPAQSPPALAPSHLGLLARTTASNLSCRYLFALSGVPGSLTITCFFFGRYRIGLFPTTSPRLRIDRQWWIYRSNNSSINSNYNNNYSSTNFRKLIRSPCSCPRKILRKEVRSVSFIKQVFSINNFVYAFHLCRFWSPPALILKMPCIVYFGLNGEV